MKKTISTPVVAIVIAGILVTGIFTWRGLSRHGKSDVPEGATLPLQTEDSISNDSTTRASIAQEDNLADLVPLPLSTILVEPENGMWTADNGYLSVPRGTQSLGGIEFHLEGMLQMQGIGSERAGRKYRSEIRLPLAEAGVTSARIGSLHLLGGTRFSSDPGAFVAEIIWRYSNGQSKRSRLVYGEHIRDWNRNAYEQPAHLPYPYTKVVWRAAEATPAGHQLRVDRVTLENPEPGKPVRQIELSSGFGAATLFVVAATLDPLAPGARPDDSPDLEPTDAIAPQYIDVRVQSSEGRLLPQANLRVQARLKNDKGTPASKQLTTDASGVANVSFPPKNLGSLEITASHDDFASRKMVWDLIAGDVIPSSYQFKLVAGVNIGGVIVDESDFPVSGAKLSFYRFWSGGDERNRKGEQAEFNLRATASDAEGAWQMKDLPRELLANIGFNVEHPDYLSTNLNVGNSAPLEKQLLAGTYKIVLHRGLEVRGLVTDENGAPISGATIWSGRQFFRERQQTKSDDAGHFVFRHIAEGDVLFSAMAKGRNPESKNFKVSPAMSEIVFKLGPGSIIKGIVQDQAGAPISGVRVSLEGNGLHDSGYEFSATTGEDGRFEWDGSPDESMQFYFGKAGYAQLRNKFLKPNVENTVTLRQSRQVQGQVVDADSSQPITKFHVAAGTSIGPDRFNSGYPGSKDYADANGQFTLALDEEDQSAIQVGADDYSDQTQSLPKDQDRMITMEFRLKANPGLHGIVVGPDGSPLPAVQVAIVKEGFGGSWSVSMRNGRLEKHGDGAPVATTDPEGKFSIGSPPESGGKVIALGEAGFGSASVEQVRASGVLMLQSFGQIEGVLKIGGEPASGKELLFTLQNLGVSTDFQNFKVETDDQGKFKFEKLPAGEGQIVRLIKTSPNSWAHSHTTSVTVEPGQTTTVNLGDSGALIKGRVRFETPPADGEAPTIRGNLNTFMEKPPSFSSPADAQAFYQSPERLALVKQQKFFAIAVNPDGSFLVDSIPPGSYTLTMNTSPVGSPPWEMRPGTPSSTRSINVTVPDSPDPFSPIDVGEIVLPPAQRTQR